MLIDNYSTNKSVDVAYFFASERLKLCNSIYLINNFNRPQE